MLFKGVVMPGFVEEAWQELRSRRIEGIWWGGRVFQMMVKGIK